MYATPAGLASLWDLDVVVNCTSVFLVAQWSKYNYCMSHGSGLRQTQGLSSLIANIVKDLKLRLQLQNKLEIKTKQNPNSHTFMQKTDPTLAKTVNLLIASIYTLDQLSWSKGVEVFCRRCLTVTYS